MDTRTTTFTNVNTNKRKAHIWISSLTQGIPGSVELPGSPGSSQLYDINIQPDSMPGYSKYTVQIKMFQLNPVNTAATPLLPPVFAQSYMSEIGTYVQGCFIDIEGFPVEMNYLPDTIQANQERNNQRLGHAFGAFDGSYSHAGYCATTSPDQPKIVVTREILGNNQVRISIIDQATFELVLGSTAAAPANFIALPTWGMCLEVEGVDGFEDDPRSQYMKQPNPTNGINTMNHSGFQDSYKKKPFRQIGL
jgi:hypothetical protein